MTKILLISIIQLAIVTPLILFFLREKTKASYFRVFLFAAVFLVYSMLLYFPLYYQQADLIFGSWNWTGKLLSILFDILCCFLFKKYFADHNYFTLHQNKSTIKSTAFASFILVIIGMLSGYFSKPKEFNSETLWFQFTMPGLDEEILFRGVLLGLLMTILSDKITVGRLNFGNPGVLIISILFGLVHGLGLLDDWKFYLNFSSIISTMFTGYIFGWIAIKSRSILLPTITHNLYNFFLNLVSMLK